MSIEAIRQVTETEQANKQHRAAAEAEARQLVLDAERNGTELLKKVQGPAAAGGGTGGAAGPGDRAGGGGGEPAPARAGGTAFG